MLSLFANLRFVPFRKAAAAAIMTNVILMVALFVFKDRLPPQVPLLYGMARGEEQLVPTLGLAVPALVSLGIIFLNTGVTLFVKDSFLSRALIIAALATSLFASVTIIRIALLVGNF